METEDFEDMLVRALAANETLSVFAHCEVVYSGRAETFLGRGDRLLVIKADCSVLVHQPEGSMPVNYMKQGTQISVEHTEHHIILHMFNQKEKAWMDVEIFRIYSADSHKLEDGQKLDLAGNERDMSDYIRDNPQIISENFRPIKREEQTDVGFIDVFGHDANGSLVVIECKRITASLQAVDQLRRYVERVKQIKGTEQVEGILAAPGITPNAKEMLVSWGFSFCRVEPPKRLERWQKDQKSLVEF